MPKEQYFFLVVAFDCGDSECWLTSTQGACSVLWATMLRVAHFCIFIFLLWHLKWALDFSDKTIVFLKSESFQFCGPEAEAESEEDKSLILCIEVKMKRLNMS